MTRGPTSGFRARRRSTVARPRRAFTPNCARGCREVADNGWAVFAAEQDGRVAGLLAIIVSEGVLRQLFIDETLRSRGIGKALLDFAKAQMRGGVWLRTHSLNVRGHKFYEREGLRHLRTEPHPQFPDAIFRIYAWQPA